MALSFILMELVSATPLQAFSAGAALSATSLGTTFTILSTTQLTTTRLGTVTTSAAMLDDVIGLVMVQIISNLGENSSFHPVTVIRPVLVSIGFAVGLLLVCAFCLEPAMKRLIAYKEKFPAFTGTSQFAFLAHTCVLVGTLAGATYAGTSSLFAAYLAGVIVSWFDGLLAESRIKTTAPEPAPSRVDSRSSRENPLTSATAHVHEHSEQSTPPPVQNLETHQHSTGESVYNKYYREPTNRILLPLFFVSPLSQTWY